MTLDEAENFIVRAAKHRGSRLRSLVDHDPLYLNWLAGEPIHGDFLEAVILINEHYDKEITTAVEKAETRSEDSEGPSEEDSEEDS